MTDYTAIINYQGINLRDGMRHADVSYRLSSSTCFNGLEKTCLVGFLEYFEDGERKVPVTIAGFPLTIPPINVRCSQQKDSYSLTFVVYPITNNRNCTFDECSILLETFAPPKERLNNLTYLKGLQYKPICSLKDTAELQVGQCQEKKKMFSWNEAHNACTTLNATLPVFDSIKELRLFIQTIQMRWSNGSNYLVTSFLQDGKDCNADIYQEIFVFIGYQVKVFIKIILSH